MTIKILLAEDHEIVREGFRSLLEKQEDMEVIAEASDGLTAVRLVRELSPHIVVMDVAMPELNGIEATRQIRSMYPLVKIVALSIHSQNRYVEEMMKAGASGYLLKNCAFQELTQAIRAVMEDKTYLSPKVARVVVEQVTNGEEKLTRKTPISLSAREREVLQLLAEGNSSKAIAARLHVSVRTVDAHRQNIMDKLKIHSVAELTKYAIREGITFLEP